MKLSQYRGHSDHDSDCRASCGTSAYNLLARLHRSLRIENWTIRDAICFFRSFRGSRRANYGRGRFVLASRQSLQLGLERLARRFYSFFHNQNLGPGP
jgi:hypothetical protein